MSSAVFSLCRTWRYTLTREVLHEANPLDGLGLAHPNDDPLACLFVCLNPSTADESVDDPTVRRCVRFAHDWGYATVTVCNIFALRSTDPKLLYSHPDPVGPENMEHLAREATRHELVVAAWGNHGEFRSQGRRVMDVLKREAPDGVVHVLGLNVTIQPKHPLYVRADTWPRQLWP